MTKCVLPCRVLSVRLKRKSDTRVFVSTFYSPIITELHPSTPRRVTSVLITCFLFYRFQIKSTIKLLLAIIKSGNNVRIFPSCCGQRNSARYDRCEAWCFIIMLMLIYFSFLLVISQCRDVPDSQPSGGGSRQERRVDISQTAPGMQSADFAQSAIVAAHFEYKVASDIMSWIIFRTNIGPEPAPVHCHPLHLRVD